MRKIEIRIIKPQLGLPKGETKSVDRRVAVDMVERGVAEFVNDEDKAEIEERKAANAEKSNAVIERNAEKSKARTAVDDKRNKKSKDDAEAARKKQLNMTLGRRKSLLKPFSEFIDLKSEDFKLTIETTKEQFQSMQSKAAQAKVDHEAAIVEKQQTFDSRVVELSVYDQLIDVTKLTIDTTKEEFDAMMTEGAEKVAESDSNNQGRNTEAGTADAKTEEVVKKVPSDSKKTPTKKVPKGSKK